MKRWMGIIIILLMVSSVLGLVFSYQGGSTPAQQSIRYGDYVFTLQDNLYVTEIEGVEMGFYYTPDIAQSAALPLAFTEQLNTTEIFSITQDIEDNAVDFLSVLTYDVTRAVSESGGFVQVGFTTPVEQLPVITCENATSLTVYVHSSNSTESTFANNCLDVELATNADIALYRDALIYSYFGVI